MLVYHQLKLPYFHSEEDFINRISKLLRIPVKEIIEYQILKQSIDARKKPTLFATYSVVLKVENEQQVLKRFSADNLSVYKNKPYIIPVNGTLKMMERPVVIGSGPCGLFATLLLAKQGYNPILLERGKKVEERVIDVNEFWNTGVLNEKSNVQFGEGGAGTFSDGKLNTQVKDKNSRMLFILETLVEYGADPSVLYQSKPHVGTDKLKNVLVNMRAEIIALGGEVRFESQVTDFIIENDQIKALEINHETTLDASICILAIGHSARDTFQVLFNDHIKIEKKNFSIGLRVEHKREFIDELQYGKENVGKVSSAPYKLTYQTKTGTGVYSFCVCPGGYVINASSEKNKLAINGMSYFARAGKNTNSAIVIQVDDKIITESHPLAGMHFQEKLEGLAYKEGDGAVLIQRYIDFCNNECSDIKNFSYLPSTKGDYKASNIRNILPEELSESFIEGMTYFGKKMKGFNADDTIISGIETRTSSPIRILRNSDFQSNISGIYPSGEGAGYAGGIISAAMDGLKVAEEIIAQYAPL